MILEVRVMRAKPAALVAEIGVRSVLRRLRQGENRHQTRLGGVFDINHSRQRKRRSTRKRAVRVIASACSLGMHEEQRLAGNRENIVSGDSAKGRADGELAALLWLRDISDIQNDHDGSVSQVRRFAIGADHRGTMERNVPPGGFLALFLPWHPPAT